MDARFEVLFLEEALEFLKKLDASVAAKVIYNIDKAKYVSDPRLFKKLRDDIWEFRTQYEGLQIRLLAFWDKSSKRQTLVIATHGMVKKKDKMPVKEIEKAIAIKKQFESRNHRP